MSMPSRRISRATRGRNREERKGGSYEVLVNPAAYKQAAIDGAQGAGHDDRPPAGGRHALTDFASPRPPGGNLFRGSPV